MARPVLFKVSSLNCSWCIVTQLLESLTARALVVDLRWYVGRAGGRAGRRVYIVVSGDTCNSNSDGGSSSSRLLI